MINGIKITGNAELKVYYNIRTQTKAGSKTVKNAYGLGTYSKRR